MIVATAGHVDHGKTSLVRQLTGVETDRLPEEKKRGLTIDLGFAYHDLVGDPAAATAADELVGFVDVPGHERFVRTMVAGVCGIDFVLFVVAADDGPMPQTAEHLAILDLVGVRRGAVVITKIDRVAPERLAEVQDQVARMIANTGLAELPLVCVSSATGEGIDRLRQLLREARAATPPRSASGDFRLAVDRSFLKEGAGRVVTGTVFAGRLELDRPVRLAPTGGQARVRGIHANNRSAEVAFAGQRCALNLAGAEVRRHGISRGHWVVADDGLVECVRFDALVRVLAAEQQPLRNRTPVHVHHGAADVTGRIMLHDGGEIPPGGSAVAQVLLHQPLSAVHGEHFVLRDTSSRRTLGGGTVVDPLPLTRRATRAGRARVRQAMTAATPGEALDRLLASAESEVDVERFRRAFNLTADECSALLAARPLQLIESRSGPQAVGAARWQQLTDRCVATLESWHRDHPGQAGAKPAELRQALPEKIDQGVFSALLDAALAAGLVERDGLRLRRPGHRSQRSAAADALWQRVATEFDRHGARAPVVRDLADALKMDFTQLEKFLVVAASEGQVIRVSKNRFFLVATIREMAALAETLAAREAAGFSAAAFRDGAGIGRNAAIEILEHFDRLGFTVRVGQVRRILRPAAEAFA